MTGMEQEAEARRLEETIRGFPMLWSRQDEWWLLLQALGDLAVLAVGAWTTLTYPTLWVCIPVWVVMAGRVHALGILTHDIGHFQRLEREPFKRILFDLVICYPILMNMDYYGYAHKLHHQWSNIPGKDPYFLPLNRQSPLKFAFFLAWSTLFLPLWLILRLAIYPLTIVVPPLRRLHAKYYGQFGASPDHEDPDRLRESERIWIWALGPTLFWYAALVGIHQTGTWTAFGWAYFIPLLLSVIIGQVRLACDHVYEDARDNGLMEQLRWSTNVDAPWWQAVILAPHNAGYHGMHHLAPGIPNWYWKAAHRRLVDCGSPVYDSTVYPGYGAVIGKLIQDQWRWVREDRSVVGTVHEPTGPEPGHQDEPGHRDETVVSFTPGRRTPPSPRLIAVPAVEEINRQSRDRAYALSDLEWQTPDGDRLHAPEEMSHLYFTDVYAELDPEERLTYNQAFATGVSEQFVFLEQVLLVRGLEAFLGEAGGSISDPLHEACQSFIDEENKHSEMFRRLLLEVRPEIYEKETFDIYRLSRSEEGFLSMSMENPTVFLWWIWVATLFEEKTIDFHKRYQVNRDAIDPMHVRVHRFHCLDELRHLQMDHHFLNLLWEPAPAWKKSLNVFLFKRVMEAFVKPRRTVIAAVRHLVSRHPRLEPMTDRLVRAGMGVTESRAWHEATYSRQALPNTFALFDRFPEMHSMTSVFPLYRPRNASPIDPGCRVAAPAAPEARVPVS